MKVVIIGGDAAGMSAAMEMVRSEKTFDITVLEKGDIYSYGQCGLPYIIDGRVSSTDDLIAKSVDAFRDKYHIDARIFHEVQRVDTKNQTVYGIHTVTNEPFEMVYDKLLIATGARSNMPAWENNNLENIFTVKSIPKMHALMESLHTAKSATIIGAGFIGLEVAEALVLRGLHVRLIDRGDRLMRQLAPQFSQKLHDEAQKYGIELCLQQDVVGFEGIDHVTAVRTKVNTYKTDIVIVAAGITPNTEMIDAEKWSNGALIVNDRLQTSVQNVYAAGDCAVHYHRIKQAYDYVPLGTTANKQGRIAGQQIAGNDLRFAGILGTMILKFFDLTIGMTGIQTETKYVLTANHIASYYPDKKPIDMLVFTTEDGRLQGLQAIGEAGVDKRIDVFVTALYNNMTLAQLAELDLSYAPPYNGVWDPLQQLAKRFS